MKLILFGDIPNWNRSIQLLQTYRPDIFIAGLSSVSLGQFASSSVTYTPEETAVLYRSHQIDGVINIQGENPYYFRLLKELGIEVFAYTKAIGPVQIDENRFSKEERDKNALYMPDAQAAAQAEEYLQEKMKELDSCGGIVECVITGMPVGVGEPVFDKLSANLGKAILSIGAVKGFEIGDGFAAAASAGSENNDDFYNDNGTVKKKTNHAGGVLGGMSDGSVITFRAAFKPTPSIAQPQQTVNRDGKDTEIVIHGRHDPIIVPRAVVVVETMAAVTVLDLLLQNMGSRLDSVKNFYENEKK